jgi:hypothetical protein
MFFAKSGINKTWYYIYILENQYSLKVCICYKAVIIPWSKLISVEKRMFDIDQRFVLQNTPIAYPRDFKDKKSSLSLKIKSF